MAAASHRDRNNISAGPPDGMTMPAASMMLIRPLWLPSVGQNSKKIMGAEGRSRIGVKTSLEVFGAGFSVQMVTAQDDTRVSCQFDVAFRNHKKRPGSRGAAGQSGRKRPTWAPDGDATNNGRQMLTLSDRVEGPAARRRISMHRKPTHPDAQGIADDGRDENGEHQRPAAKVAIEVHR